MRSVLDSEKNYDFDGPNELDEIFSAIVNNDVTKVSRPHRKPKQALFRSNRILLTAS